MTFYIDVIFIENIIMNYIIILTAGMICKSDIKQIRIFISSILGALYAVMLYLLKSPIYTNQMTKLLLSIVMVYIAFSAPNIKAMLKQLLIFYLTSFCFGGTAYYLLYCVNPNLIKSVNGIFIGTYPIKIAILGGILGFFVINISFKIIKNRLTKKDMLYDIEIFYKEKKLNIKVILDTGNLLTEPITNTPVLIVEENKVNKIIPKDILESLEKMLHGNTLDEIDEDLKKRCSIIPFSSIGKSNGIMLGFRPDYIKIHMQSKEEIRKKVLIGIYQNKITKNGVYSGLMGLNLLDNECESKLDTCLNGKERY